MLDPALVEAIASELGVQTGLIEKDWHVVRALSVLAGLDHGIAQPAFSGGTSLSKGWQLISRFSEDIDFKIDMPATATRRQRSDYRKAVLTALQEAGFTLSAAPLVGDNSSFFRADFLYQSLYPTGPGLRPHLRVEMSFDAPALAPIPRPLQSFVSQALQQPPEVAAFPCVDPVETAADKLSALAWRTCIRDRDDPEDDPTLIRHLHDLAALEAQAINAAGFLPLLQQKAEADSNRGREGARAPVNPAARFAEMLKQLGHDPLWAAEYEEFVRQVSFASPDQQITFPHALAATTRLVTLFLEAADH